MLLVGVALGSPVPPHAPIGPSAHAEHAARAVGLASHRARHAPPPTTSRPDHTVYGYLPYWTVDVADVPWDHLTHLAIFSVALNSDGSLSSTSTWTSRAAEAVSLGHAAGVKIHLCVTSFDSDTIDSVLSSSSRRATAVAALAAQVDAYGADGVNIDFENMSSGNITDLISFTEELKAAVDEVYLATPAVDWAGAYWYSRLAEASDGLFIMGYGYHWTGGGPGPNAPLDDGEIWSQWTLAWTVQDYLDADTPADKIVLGLPTYGQEWPVSDSSAVPADATDDGWSVTYAEAVDEAATYGRRYDDVSDTAWYASSSTRQAWYDDDETLGIKMQWAVDQGLAGFGFWAIGYDEDDPAFWAAVDAASHEDPPEDTSGDDTAEPDTDPPDTDPPDGRSPRAHLLPGEEAGCGCDHAVGPLPLGLLLALLARRARNM